MQPTVKNGKAKMTQPTVTEKEKYTLSVQYQSKDGSFKTAVVEKDFGLPEIDGDVTVNVVEDDGVTTRQVNRAFKRIVLESKEDVLDWLQDEDKTRALISAANYGLDLYARNAIKGPIASEEEGPGKVIAKLADQIMTSYQKLGKTITREKALEKAQRQMEED